MGRRILHVFGGMNRGGAETWLMHVLHHIDRTKFHMDFLVHTTQPCAYDDEIRALGSQIIPCMHPSRPMIYASNFKRILREYGPYDVIHSHVHHYSGYVLRLAHHAGVPTRIAHSHNDTSRLQANARFSRALYLALMRRWIRRYATEELACSTLAGAALFDVSQKSVPQWKTLYCGIDTAPYIHASNSPCLRAELGIPSDAFVIGHVGRFVEQKNHEFLVDIMAKIAQRESKIHLLLVGDGPLRLAITKKVAQANLSDKITFVGVRSDVPRLMSSVMEMFIFPSLFEGLGVVLIEAQAAGLPCLVSDIVSEEVDVVHSLVRRLSLSQPASEWAKVILAMRADTCRVTRSDALATVVQSPFNIQTNIRNLERFYSDIRMS